MQKYQPYFVRVCMRARKGVKVRQVINSVISLEYQSNLSY